MSSDDEFGPHEALAHLLAKRLQGGREISEGNWEWLYGHCTRNKPATLEEFKTQFTWMVGLGRKRKWKM
jgi:hypothetical protein